MLMIVPNCVRAARICSLPVPMGTSLRATIVSGFACMDERGFSNMRKCSLMEISAAFSRASWEENSVQM